MKRISILLLALSIPIFHFAQGTWTQKANMLGNARFNLIGFAIQNKGYITGGTFGGLSVSDNCQEYDPVADTWTNKAPMPAPFRAGAGFSANDLGYATTGVNEAMFIQELYQYNSLGDNWSSVAPFPGDVRMFATGFSILNRGYISCGSYINITPLNDLWEYYPQANTWQQKTSMPGAARYDACAFSVAVKGYVFGGYDGSVIYKDLWEYNQTSDTWVQKASLPGAGRSAAMAFSIGDYGYIVGGWLEGNVLSDEVWQYNSINDTWIQLQNFPGPPSAGGTAFSINGLGYVVGGYDGTECWEYNPGSVGTEDPFREEIVVKPNPFSEMISIISTSPLSGDYTITISEMTGKKMIEKHFTAQAGEKAFSIDARELAPGAYLACVSSFDMSVKFTRKIVKY